MAKDEKAKLKTMLNYWLEHNKEHRDEFKDWADKARGLKEAEVAEDLLAAAGEMEKVNERLSSALNSLG